MLSKLGLIYLFTWLIRSSGGRIVLLALALWYLDNRYLGWLDALWRPVRRSRLIAGLRQEVERNPSDVRSMVELGDHYLHAGRPRLAADYLERATARGEDGARAQYLLGAAMVQLGKHAEGRSRLEAAVAAKADLAYGEPYLYLLEEAFATLSPQNERVDDLVRELSRFESVEILTRAGQICGGAGRKDLARTLLAEAIRNYGYIPPKMRRRQRHWLVRARWALLTI